MLVAFACFSACSSCQHLTALSNVSSISVSSCVLQPTMMRVAFSVRVATWQCHATGGVLAGGHGFSKGLVPDQLYATQLMVGAGSRSPFTVSVAPAWGDRCSCLCPNTSWVAAVVAMSVLAAASAATCSAPLCGVQGEHGAVSVMRPQVRTRLKLVHSAISPYPFSPYPFSPYPYSPYPLSVLGPMGENKLEPGVVWWSVGAAAAMPPKEGLPVVSRQVAVMAGLWHPAAGPPRGAGRVGAPLQQRGSNRMALPRGVSHLAHSTNPYGLTPLFFTPCPGHPGAGLAVLLQFDMVQHILPC
jgi:hypothetical protein